MKKQERVQQIGAATYIIDRIFSSTKTPQDLVAEEIITSAKQRINFDHSNEK